MDNWLAVGVIDVLARELALFACAGFLIGGIDDLAIDLLWLSRGGGATAMVPGRSHRLAVFVAAWDEGAVIGAMLTSALARLDHPAYRLYVGVYPNDRPTAAAVARIAARDQRVRMVVNPRPGPTTKGDNLNAMWRALLRDEAADGWRADAVVLHDAEDLVDPTELSVFDGLLADFAVVQLPVVPLIAPESRWVSAHYADEFALAHERTLCVRQAVGAGLPLAGVGCALRRDALDRLAAERCGDPFDAASLTEDYELGLTIAERGGRGCFARVFDQRGRMVCVRSYFPTTIEGAVRQKARWIAGIALMGWDRLGWGGSLSLSEYWMRMRDRRGPIAMLVLAAAYLALMLVAASIGVHVGTGAPPPPVPPAIAILLAVNSALLVWRLATRGFRDRTHLRLARRGAGGAAIGGRQHHRVVGGPARSGHLRRRAVWTHAALGQDQPCLPERGRGMMRGRPPRFLSVLATGWIGVRVVLLWPDAALVPGRIAPIAPIARAAAKALLPPLHPTPLRFARPESVQGDPRQAVARAAARVATPPRDTDAQILATVGLTYFIELPGARPALQPAAYTAVAPVGPIATMGQKHGDRSSPWALDSWLLLRGGAAGGSFTPQLGGSQAGIRITRALDANHRTAAFVRIAKALGDGGAEAAMGAQWRPTKAPVVGFVEMRRRADGSIRPAVGVFGGVYRAPVAGRFRLDGYGQAGVIGASDGGGFADGQARIALPVGGTRPTGATEPVAFDIGIGAWAAAQRRATRFDLGPSIGVDLKLPRHSLRLTLDWRQRVAGHAAPDSGPVLTVAAGF